ncbi:xylulose kinase [Georgenia sp. EYE_87]|uniref:FGGY family carbohydrate kinase n=1 Tax=Georgenia sp. EYE_87 TaxID=2853448 RepID=UPI0020035C0F|nr:FGGY family carbohydrate kinase [Georgenia sp. EYE_87]MCK6211880.1 xylulose kinase [Georgenia sp. EYE_87]
MSGALVAGVDSSTQSCKVVVRDAGTGALRRFGQAPHPEGTEVDPEAWWDALQAAVAAAGGLDDVAAVSVAGQQHGMVVLDADGEVIRPALLWNDTRSARAAEDLIAELEPRDAHRPGPTAVDRGGRPGPAPGRAAGTGRAPDRTVDHAAGRAAWAVATGSVPVASFTVTKLRWLADHEPENAARVAAVALPHDWLTWRLAGAPGLDGLVTDRSEASGTGYFDTARGTYRRDLLALALRRDDAAGIVLPRVLGPQRAAGTGAPDLGEFVLGPGAGDNAAAALALGMGPGDVAISIGTSGVVSAVSPHPVADDSGLVAGFADATGAFLPVAVTLNASRVLDAVGRLLGVDHDGLSALALAAAPGAGGLTLVPYLEGERTPDLPDATGSLLGLTLASATRENLARAAVEAVLCGLADGLAALEDVGAPAERIRLVGGGARSEAVRRIAPTVLGRPVQVPEVGEYVADGAARQAAWVLAGRRVPPSWTTAAPARTYVGEPARHVRERYAEVRHLHVPA